MIHDARRPDAAIAAAHASKAGNGSLVDGAAAAS